MENENMNNEIQAPEPNSVEFAQQPVPTMANQNMPTEHEEDRRHLEHEEEDEVEEVG